MTTALPLLFEVINQAKDEPDLRSHFVPKLGDYFAATRRGVFFFDQLPAVDQRLKELWRAALSIEQNPVARYLVERHAPVHEELVTSPKVWTTICPRPDHWHVMAGPIVSRGQLVGAVGCTRDRSMPAFNTANLTDLSAICLHISVWASITRLQPQPCKADCLTPRELEIAELVASGRTNAEIGTELWITENSVKQALKRMFRKLEVSSRTEMTTQLFTERR
ncbi:MAG: LuxR C-terminal-related transcriptional regulator [Cyanobacteria bacterium P01_H01_bin.58]